MRVLSIAFLMLVGCNQKSDEKATPQAQSDQKTSPEKISRDSVRLSDAAWFDLMGLIQSYGDEVSLNVENEKVYRIKVILRPRRNDTEVIHDRLVTSSSDRFIIGVYSSLAYTVSKKTVVVDPENHQLTMDVAGRSFVKIVNNNLPSPFDCISKEIVVTQKEKPFLVMFHGNDMGASNFEIAVRHGYYSGQCIIATIQQVPKMHGEQAKPPTPGS